MSDDLQVTWKRGYRKANLVSAETVYKEFEKIRGSNHGELNAENIVDRARSARNKLHKLFTWDDEEAGRQLRLIEAARLIRSIEVVRPESPELGSTRAYQLARSSQEPRKQVYKTIDEVIKSPDDRAALINRALGELIAVRRRYAQLQELAIVFRAIAEVIETYKP